MEYEKITSNTNSEKREEYWNIAKGLNRVDNLKPSKYMEKLIEKNIVGQISTNDIEDELKHYYSQEKNIVASEMECDFVSKRMVDFLDGGCFSFSPVLLKTIHGHLFKDLLPERYTGEYRDYNISKKEEILNGDTVVYGDFKALNDLLLFEFMSERQNKYCSEWSEKQIGQLSEFTTRIWEAHPFIEGNTRTTALFIQMYLQSRGFDVDNTLFKEKSVFFRNALVRNCYVNALDGINQTDKYINAFLSSLFNKGENMIDEYEKSIAADVKHIINLRTE